MKTTQTMLYKIGRKAICLYALFLLKMDVQWHAHPPKGPNLIVANHPSTTDPFYLLTLFPQPLSLLIIENAFQVPVFGEILRRSGHIAVSMADKHSAFEAAQERLQAGHSVAIFPEGDISPREGGCHATRSGAARLALMTGVPVIPVGIYLNRERCRRIDSSISGKRTRGYWYLRGPYGITVGRPMDFKGDVKDRSQVDTISTAVMQQIDTLAHDSQQRIEA
jgi:1-acyl-sn-glycerol-3-phosphate acyltransferase